MSHKIDQLTIQGFKSIQSLDSFPLGDLNILIGANGSGKSNFVEFFRLLHAIINKRLQSYVNKYGPSDGFFFNGVQQTKKIVSVLNFHPNAYKFSLAPSASGGILIDSEYSIFYGDYEPEIESLISMGGVESELKDRQGYRPNYYVFNSISNWTVYHFHDTTLTAGMRRPSGIEQTDRLRSSGENLSAFLYHLRKESVSNYSAIRSTIQQIAPYFDDFDFRINHSGPEAQVRLVWHQKGKEYIFSPGHFSDGTIRFICLVTALLQPRPPSLIVVDEPELGLHPEALAVLAGLLRSVSKRTQIIVATQSPVLLNEFEPEHIITVDQNDGVTQLRRLNAQDLAVWLDDYTLGDLWLKGTIHGGINHD